MNELEILNLAPQTFKNNVPSIAYVPQEAWIFGGTIRENILMGRKFVQEKYKEVIEVCSLGKVLTLLNRVVVKVNGEIEYFLSTYRPFSAVHFRPTHLKGKRYDFFKLWKSIGFEKFQEC